MRRFLKTFVDGSRFKSNDISIIMEGNRIEVVDYLKGFSIFTIAFMHLLHKLHSMPSSIITLSRIGGTGVHVFFVCSGIGLYISYLNNKTNFMEFIKKRFFKIYVPYAIIILISFFVPYMYSGNDRIIALMSHILLFKMFVPHYLESFGTQFWFISTIIQIYLVFIPICVIKEKIKDNQKTFVLFMSISIIWWILCYALGLTGQRIWCGFFLQYIWEFVLGMILAEMIWKGNEYKLPYRSLAVAAIFGIGLQTVMALSSSILCVFNDIPALIGYSSLALLFLKMPFMKKIGVWLSTISYELYLIHILAFTLVLRLVQPHGLWLELIVGIAAMFIAIVAAYFYHLIIRAVISKIEK